MLDSLFLQIPNLFSDKGISCVWAGYNMRLQFCSYLLRPLKDSNDSRGLVLVALVECDQAGLGHGCGCSGDVGNGRHRCVRGSGMSVSSGG